MPKTKLQKQTSRQHKGIKYSKYVIIIPPKVVNTLQWTQGTELTIKTEKGKMTLERN